MLPANFCIVIPAQAGIQLIESSSRSEAIEVLSASRNICLAGFPFARE